MGVKTNLTASINLSKVVKSCLTLDLKNQSQWKQIKVSKEIIILKKKVVSKGRSLAQDMLKKMRIKEKEGSWVLRKWCFRNTDYLLLVTAALKILKKNLTQIKLLLMCNTLNLMCWKTCQICLTILSHIVRWKILIGTFIG